MRTEKNATISEEAEALQYARTQFKDHVELIAKRFRWLAASIERRRKDAAAKGYGLRPSTPIGDYDTEPEVARHILHEIFWTLPNLYLEDLLREAERSRQAAERLAKEEEA
mgnify:CR=1 FL=1